MNLVQSIIGSGLLVIGLAFMSLGSIGIIRLPDFYTRTHAASKVDTVGLIIALAGIATLEGATLDGAKVVAGAIFIMLSNPVAAHALGRAAYQSGLRPWTRNNPSPDTTTPEE